MITSLGISNFRCFEEITVNGLRRVNLIGGMNGIGKTALLEALYLHLYPSHRAVSYLQECCSRSISEYTHNESSWPHLFNKLDMTNPVEIKSTGDIDKSVIVEYVIEQGLTQLSHLRIHSKLGHLQQKTSSISASGVSRTGGKIDKNVVFISNRSRINMDELAFLFDLADSRGRYLDILDNIKTLDDSIEDITTSKEKHSSTILVKRRNSDYTPLLLCGELLQKAVIIILKIMSVPGGTILIDEIENGIHFMSQNPFWAIIFQLSNIYNVQVFATAHSHEMISAFNMASDENCYDDDVMYFELARHCKSKRIKANSMDMEMLLYEIQTKSSFRGE